MGELLIAVAILGALGVLAALLAVAPATLLVAGFWIAVAGLAFGVPTGAVYHVALRNALLGAERLPARWWLQPDRPARRESRTQRARACSPGATPARSGSW